MTSPKGSPIIVTAILDHCASVYKLTGAQAVYSMRMAKNLSVCMRDEIPSTAYTTKPLISLKHVILAYQWVFRVSQRIH